MHLQSQLNSVQLNGAVKLHAIEWNTGVQGLLNILYPVEKGLLGNLPALEGGQIKPLQCTVNKCKAVNVDCL